MTSFIRKANQLINTVLPPYKIFPTFFTLIFFCLGLIGILNHAMWRDELNVWLIARDSNSLIELFGNIKYEGHPGLWYLCLTLLNQFTHNPVSMQILHLLIATASVYIFLRFSPFTNLQKILFSLGYLPFYEYLVISRNYALGILLIFAFCALFNTRIKSYVWLALILFLLANTNAYCLLISVALGVILIVEYSLGKKVTESLTASRTNIISSLIIFFLGIISSLAQLIPPADSTLQGGLAKWMLQFDLKHLAAALSRIWNSYMVIVVPGDSRFFDVVIFAIFSLLLFAFTSTILIKKPIAFLLYVFGTLEIIFFVYVKFLGSARHYGHLYILLIVSFWIASYYPNSNLLLPKTRIAWKFGQQVSSSWINLVKKYQTVFLMVILCSQLIGGIVAFSRDLIVPYSASREASRFIKEQHLDKMFIVASRDATVSPLCGYLNRKFYYPERKDIGSFVLFNTQRQDVTTVDVLEQVSQIMKQKKENILLILNYELKNSSTDLSISPLAKFTKSLIFNEKYYLYLVGSKLKP
jgi:hypothetical protein